MASARSRSRLQTPRRIRQTRSARQGLPILINDDVRVSDTQEPCIDLTVASPEHYIDLTRNRTVIDESPTVVLTQADNVGPVQRRRGSGRRGVRRSMNYSTNRQAPQRGSGPSVSVTPSNVDPAPQVHVFVWDNSDGEELPEVPFQIPSSSSATNSSLLTSPEGIKISCPVCMDDVKQIKKSRRQVMSTICGHIFCDECIRTAIQAQHACPTCRKLLNIRNIHPIFL